MGMDLAVGFPGEHMKRSLVWGVTALSILCGFIAFVLNLKARCW